MNLSGAPMKNHRPMARPVPNPTYDTLSYLRQTIA
jgi:hypothetical protein